MKPKRVNRITDKIMKGIPLYTPVCSDHGKIIHFAMRKNGSWMHVSDVRKAIDMEIRQEKRGKHATN